MASILQSMELRSLTMWIFVVLVFCVLYFSRSTYKRPPGFPPGPPCVPLLGNLLSVWYELRRRGNHHSVWQRWARQYGDVLGLKLGGIDVVVVSGKDLIKEVSSRDVFDGRPEGFFYRMRSFGKKLGIVFTDGPAWSATRRVVLKYLKTFGYGTRSMETLISEECRALVQLRMKDDGKPVVVKHMFAISVVNILWRVMAGKRYDLDDLRLKRIVHLITRSFKVVDMSGGLLNFMPGLRHVAPGLIGYTELKEVHDEIYSFLKDIIQDHQRTLDVKRPRDVIDAFLIEMIEQKNHAFSEEELQVVCLDLLEAGMETVSNTAEFMLLHVLLHEEVQMKLHKEIDAVVGSARNPTMADRSKMVYTEAVILEGLRISSVAAVGIPHMTLDNAQLDQYVIPKGTWVLLAMHDLHNGSHWKDPKVFRPERFLTKDGNLIQDEWLMPFGTGRRRCIGEGLARSELFLLLTHILQRFQLCHPPVDPPPSTEPVDGVSLSPQPFRIVFKSRV